MATAAPLICGALQLSCREGWVRLDPAQMDSDYSFEGFMTDDWDTPV